jgi:hypothetical protein
MRGAAGWPIRLRWVSSSIHLLFITLAFLHLSSAYLSPLRRQGSRLKIVSCLRRNDMPEGMWYMAGPKRVHPTSESLLIVGQIRFEPVVLSTGLHTPTSCMDFLSHYPYDA